MIVSPNGYIVKQGSRNVRACSDATHWYCQKGAWEAPNQRATNGRRMPVGHCPLLPPNLSRSWQWAPPSSFHASLTGLLFVKSGWLS